MADNIVWLDFNDAPEQESSSTESGLDAKELKARLLERLSDVLAWLFPNGKTRGRQFFIGDLQGNRGKSLVVELEGPKAGMWIDFATGESGDVFDLWAANLNLDSQRQFPELVREISRWLGDAPPAVSPTTSYKPPVDELGPWSAKWDYHDGEGKLIACVYRYDTPDGKEYRPWDVRTRKMHAPNPRPLYNQPGMSAASEVVLVEGEKAADALIQQGIMATTAMNGANAPVDKTDWSPLKNKRVLIWPDKDEAGMQYAERVRNALLRMGTASVAILEPPADKPDKWDAFDAVAEKMDVAAFLQSAPRFWAESTPGIPVFSLGQLLADTSPMPDDLIEPRVLTPGGMIVFGGAPKVGKSDFLLTMLTHMAAGEPFLELNPPRPLRVFYLQAEVQYHYLRERFQAMQLPTTVAAKAAGNLKVTPQLKLVLNDDGMAQVALAMREAFVKPPLDVLVIDPIRNVFDGGPDGASENDNNAMLFFLRERVEQLRDAVNPEAGVILAHHTKKIGKKQIEEDPFLALSGAGSLRGYYTTGMLLYRPDESRTDRMLVFELRNGPGLPPKRVDKSGGRWVELDQHSERLVNQDHGARLDAERRRKRDVILQLIFDEAADGRIYTANQFAESFEGKAGLGANRTINERLAVLATKGYIKFFRNPEDYGLPPLTRSKFGNLCVEQMTLPSKEQVDTDTGEITRPHLAVKPTHYKCPQSGAVLPVEDPDVWIYHEEDQT
ncbi:AAA family ATPase [uncultured Marinobacter sp.]|uniref:AAA family ATPase n=1 Tax=uncultured Marinobacter sp. TaxID=187379 RepID=UPI0030DA5ADF|tara:strand:- start:35405 stop:37582 length:2178 start_codon:yes stop_codon:yes gene_type:complete